MIDNVKLEITSRSTGGSSSKFSVGYINPDATDAKLKSLAQALTNLSTNTFESVTKIVTRDITNAQ